MIFFQYYFGHDLKYLLKFFFFNILHGSTVPPTFPGGYHCRYSYYLKKYMTNM